MKANQYTKYFVLDMVTMGIFSTMIVPSMAAMIHKQITVSTGVNIYVDDVKLHYWTVFAGTIGIAAFRLGEITIEVNLAPETMKHYLNP